jgi:hypothetical protein
VPIPEEHPLLVMEHETPGSIPETFTLQNIEEQSDEKTIGKESEITLMFKNFQQEIKNLHETNM